MSANIEKIQLQINGTTIKAEKGMTILQAALNNNIYIPHLCYHPDLKGQGACRLCLVEVNGHILPSCLTFAEEGMVIKTENEEINKVRRTVLELIISNHHYDCRNCPATGKCELQRIMARLKIKVKKIRPLIFAKENSPIDVSNPYFDYDPNKCVLCGICVRTCEEIVGAHLLNFFNRGYSTKISFFGDGSRCASCGECIRRCPVGALREKSHK